MKKIFVFFLTILTFLFFNAFVVSKKNQILNHTKLEIKAIYISYIEYLSYFEGNALNINKSNINRMLDNVRELGFNTIFLHTNPFSDSIYKSKIFPYSYTLTGVEGKNPGMDYLEYFINESHKRNIKVHAWINPYRISNTNDTSKISEANPAYNLLNTNEVKVDSSGIYYNPSSSKVVDIILQNVYEIISNYSVDGIHFDDYFYVIKDIDLENYSKYGNNLSIEEYRLNIINSTIKRVYKLIKDYNSNIVFSIAPDGNIENNYKMHFADVKTWLKEDGYVDIIMPEVYYGFENEYKPFIKTLKEWNDLIENKVKLVPVLAFYKVGVEDIYAGSGNMEWILNNDIIKREINYSKTLNNYNGYALFRYEYIFDTKFKNINTNAELQNLLDNKN